MSEGMNDWIEEALKALINSAECSWGKQEAQTQETPSIF